MDKEILCCFGRISVCLGDLMGLPWVAGESDAPLDSGEVGQDLSRGEGRGTRPSVLHTSCVFDA